MAATGELDVIGTVPALPRRGSCGIALQRSATGPYCIRPPRPRPHTITLWCGASRPLPHCRPGAPLVAEAAQPPWERFLSQRLHSRPGASTVTVVLPPWSASCHRGCLPAPGPSLVVTLHGGPGPQIPTAEQVAELSGELRARAQLPPHVAKMLAQLPSGTHPMTQFSAAVLSLQACPRPKQPGSVAAPAPALAQLASALAAGLWLAGALAQRCVSGAPPAAAWDDFHPALLNVFELI